MQADLTDAGAAFAVVRGHDAVIHAAAIPEPTRNPPHVVFHAAQPDNSAGLPLADLVRRHHGDAIELRAVDRTDAAGISTAKARRLLGWRPTRSWRDYLDETGATRSR